MPALTVLGAKKSNDTNLSEFSVIVISGSKLIRVKVDDDDLDDQSTPFFTIAQW